MTRKPTFRLSCCQLAPSLSTAGPIGCSTFDFVIHNDGAKPLHLNRIQVSLYDASGDSHGNANSTKTVIPLASGPLKCGM
jgi:hypothetical protein